VYGIDLTPLFYLAKYAYKDIPCDLFVPKESGDLGDEERRAIARGQKAMAIIQFKIEAKISRENPDFNLERRNLLHCIDYEKRLVTIEGAEYDMLDINLPTVDRDDPYKLTKEEQEVLDHLVREFTNCAKLQRHIMLFLERGSLYKIDGNMLLFHACVPMNPDGTLMEVEMGGQKYKGRALFDAVDARVRSVLTATGPERKRALDVLWYLWLGEGSPLFAKSKMATFELYFCSDKNIRKEKKNAFYSLLDNEEALDTIFRDFGMNPATSHMVCGHTPIKVKDGEDPVKCGGKVIMIDGGMSKAYQGTSGIAGFTLVSQNEKLTLVSHQPVQASSAHARELK
ncbi:MAG: fructose-bisphosphatase class III, partial [Eggerthellales bacterium]|nr:fructose-bisphosphatase class III [Eggerthellales bacterium]